MVKRHERSSFGSAFAFPGGVLEAADSEVHANCTGLSADDANQQLGVTTAGLDYFSAAVRELFEESGVLLGNTGPPAEAREAARAALNDETLDWASFVRDNDIAIPCESLHYFSFWITPEGLPKRYSTRFFLAELPAGQTATHCGGELTDSCWMPAADVLEAGRNRTMRVHYPTRKTLERIAEFGSTPELLGWARECAENGVLCNQPVLPPERLR